MFVDLSHKFNSNNFFGVKMDFRFRKKSEQLALMLIATIILPFAKEAAIQPNSFNFNDLFRNKHRRKLIYNNN